MVTTRSRLPSRVVTALFALLSSPALLAATDPVYAALRAARPQGPAVAVSDFVLERDVFRFRFESGTFQFLSAAEGRTIGAVFVGMGTLILLPGSEAERRHLALRRNEPALESLSEGFEELLLLFTDDTARQIEAAGRPGTAPSRAAAAFDDFGKRQRKDLRANLQIRLLTDILRPAAESTGVFLALFEGRKIPPALVAVDPAGLDWLSSDLGAEDSALFVLSDDADRGFWYLSERKRTGAPGAPGPARPAAIARHYAVETTILKNEQIRGTTTILVEPAEAGLRVLPIQLLGRLRLKEVSFAPAASEEWSPASFVQEKEKEDDDSAVLFPAPLGKEPVRVRMSYEGKDVLQDAGDGNFLVGARDSWYPNLGVFGAPVPYDLTYRFPKAYEVISVGRPLESRVEGDVRVSTWKAEKPIRVAGFNYGRFRKVERADADSGVTVTVYTNRGTPDFIREINSILETRRGAGLQHVSIDAAGVADSAMADGINTARVGTVYFGALPDPHVAITQQTQAFFGQSWPSLVYLPYLAALDATTRHELGLGGARDFVDLVGPHEFAHQWWGHLVGWKSYRDQWLSEGFAEFTAALVLQRTASGKAFNDFWEKARRRILEKPPGSAVANHAAGPMTQGWRLFGRRSPDAYASIVYTKGAYVVHMLRMMLRDGGDDRDQRFIAMMKDFVTTHAGKNPSTGDFQAVVERHMTPRMNLAGNGKMDWFFRQWVWGTEIPRFKEDLRIEKVDADRYRITGTIRQEGVSAEFRTLTHLDVEFSKGEVARLGVIPITGTVTAPIDVTVKLPKTPRRALINAFHDVLSRD